MLKSDVRSFWDQGSAGGREVALSRRGRVALPV
jgi:hypothetical protein